MRRITQTFYVDDNTRTSELMDRVKYLESVSRCVFGEVTFRPSGDGRTVQADIDVLDGLGAA